MRVGQIDLARNKLSQVLRRRHKKVDVGKFPFFRVLSVYGNNAPAEIEEDGHSLNNNRSHIPLNKKNKSL